MPQSSTPLIDPFMIPWPCLYEPPIKSNPKPDDPKPQPKPIKCFAQALTNVCDIPTSELPQPIIKGDGVSISIPDDDYVIGTETCKHNLHARIIYPKGSTPLLVFSLRAKLSSSLGKGYFEFAFSSLEDLKRVGSIVSWNLNVGFIKFFVWTRDFSPNTQQNTSAQVWVMFHGVPQKYWRKRILFAIANAIGTPICTYANASKPIWERTFGQYVRILVDMDISQPLRNKVLVERKRYTFCVEVSYENMPDYWTHCKKIGHYIEICNNVRKEDRDEPVQAPVKKKKPIHVAKHVPKKQGTKQKNPIVITEDIPLVRDQNKGKAPLVEDF